MTDPALLAADLLARAHSCLDAGAFEESWGLVRGALVLNPKSAQTLTYAGKLAVGRSAAPQAVRYFLRATLVGGSSDARALLNLAQAQQLAGRIGLATATVRRAVELFPDDVQARGVLASLLATAGDLEASAAALRPGDARGLGARLAHRLGQQLAEVPAHRPLSVELLARAASLPGPQIQAALNDFVQVASVEDPRRHDAARRRLVMAPDAVDAMDAVVAALRPQSKLVRAAAWLWQSCTLRPADLARLDLAASLTHQVLWPRHGIAANLALLANFPGRHEIVARICELHFRLGDREAALARGRELLRPDPADPRIWDSVAMMYKGVGALDEAVDLWGVILRKFPSQEVLHYNNGVLLDERNDLEAASRRLRAALLLRPSYVFAANQLGLVFHRMHRAAEAVKMARWTLVCDPAYANGYMNLGNYVRSVGDYGRALDLLGRAEDLAGETKPLAAASRYNAGMVKITLGELEAGFNLLESRWQTQGFPSPKRSFRQAIWPGPGKAPGARLLLYMEQGMGDEVMMSWYLPLLRRDTSRLLVECDERLVELFARTYEGVEFIGRIHEGRPPTHSVDLSHKIPSFHVPQYYVAEAKRVIRENWDWASRGGTRFPSRLAIDPARLDRWRHWMEREFPGRPRVAVSWRSRVRNRDRNRQYLSVEELGSTIPPGTVAINLQYSSTDDEIAELRAIGARRGFEFVTPDGVDLTNDLEDILAILQNADAALTSLISLAWMSGAVGCPAYVFRSSPERIQWQQLGMPFIPWAPSLKIFFRHPSEPWEPTLRDISDSLTVFLSRRGCG